jgi:hypothetical protein
LARFCPAYGLAADNVDDGRPRRSQANEQTDQRRRVMNNQSNNQALSGVFVALGVLLVVVGALFLVGQAVGFELGRFEWPFFVIIPGLALSGVGLATGDPTGERITPLGAAMTMSRLILLYQSSADHFESWSYAWALVFPTSTGLGRMIYGSLKGRRWSRPAGGRR